MCINKYWLIQFVLALPLILFLSICPHLKTPMQCHATDIYMYTLTDYILYFVYSVDYTSA